MANYIQIRAKKASDVIGAGVISYALIGSFLLYKFHHYCPVKVDK